ncbi:MAG: aminopeptidase [Clostridia bacterium]|nr:aminopeptidase [Clostridia bacterium]
MIDSRFKKLCKNLVNYSCNVQKGERVLIDLYGVPQNLGSALVDEVYAAGGLPFVVLNDGEITRKIMMNATEEQLKLMAEIDCKRMSEMQAYIAFRGGDNSNQNSDVPDDKLQLYSTLYSKPVHSEIRVKKTKWVVLRYPAGSMAQSAGMSTEAFEDFYFDVCNLDYSKMSKAMDPLVELMEKTDKVHIKCKGTDLSFSIKDIPAIKCDGKCNVPDGEVYTAPVKNSVNGIISYNAPSVYNGFKYENVVLEFKDGKVIKATCNDNNRITKLFDTDEGARYVGEFAIGVNPYVKRAMGDILFDEKISGSFHFTPGCSYDDANNTNKSAVHWDLVCIQTPEFGGGEIYFDGELIRKDGMFVKEELKALNPENLL